MVIASEKKQAVPTVDMLMGTTGVIGDPRNTGW